MLTLGAAGGGGGSKPDVAADYEGAFSGDGPAPADWSLHKLTANDWRLTSGVQGVKVRKYFTGNEPGFGSWDSIPSLAGSVGAAVRVLGIPEGGFGQHGIALGVNTLSTAYFVLSVNVNTFDQELRLQSWAGLNSGAIHQKIPYVANLDSPVMLELQAWHSATIAGGWDLEGRAWHPLMAARPRDPMVSKTLTGSTGTGPTHAQFETSKAGTWVHAWGASATTPSGIAAQKIEFFTVRKNVAGGGGVVTRMSWGAR